MAFQKKLTDKVKKKIFSEFFTETEYERFKATNTFDLIRLAQLDKFIAKDLEKGEYAKTKIKKMHRRLERKGLLTDKTKEQILKKTFKTQVGYDLNLENPQTFSEKIMWLKMYYQNPLVTKCADKFAMKDYVANVIGEEYVVPVIDSWVNPAHIDFDKLPDQFAIKVNWATGYLKIIKDKSEIDEAKLRKQLAKWMEPYRNSYYQAFNWGFKNMPPVVFAEKYMEQPEDGQLFDYKFFCFNGKVDMMFIATDRYTDGGELSHDFFDRDFNPLNITLSGRVHVPADRLEKPKNFDKMIELAEKLAKPFPFVRVDFYEVAGQIYVGEMTFYPGGALLKFDPEEWDLKLGQKLKLPEKVVQDRSLYYEPLTPKECYMLEDKITYNDKKQYCLQKAYAQMGYLPDLKNPTSFNEKVIWLALNYKNPDIKIASDKELVKKYIADRVGEEYVVPMIGVYTDVDDIIESELPDKFVAKASNGWGADQVMIIDNKNTCALDYLKVQMSTWLLPWANYYYQNMCITDAKVPPKIIIEEILEKEDGGSIDDFKFYCCNGEPKFALVVSGRNEKVQTRTYVDLDWNVIPVKRKGKGVADEPRKPEKLQEMLELCRKLAKDFPLVRIDFYEVDGRVYVGELTCTPGMFLGLRPIEMDYKLGECLDLTEYIDAK